VSAKLKKLACGDDGDSQAINRSFKKLAVYCAKRAMCKLASGVIITTSDKRNLKFFAGCHACNIAQHATEKISPVQELIFFFCII
jgi:hypothetical protein